MTIPSKSLPQYIHVDYHKQANAEPIQSDNKIISKGKEFSRIHVMGLDNKKYWVAVESALEVNESKFILSPKIFRIFRRTATLTLDNPNDPSQPLRLRVNIRSMHKRLNIGMEEIHKAIEENNGDITSLFKDAVDKLIQEKNENLNSNEGLGIEERGLSFIQGIKHLSDGNIEEGLAKLRLAAQPENEKAIYPEANYALAMALQTRKTQNEFPAYAEEDQSKEEEIETQSSSFSETDHEEIRTHLQLAAEAGHTEAAIELAELNSKDGVANASEYKRASECLLKKIKELVTRGDIVPTTTLFKWIKFQAITGSYQEVKGLNLNQAFENNLSVFLSANKYLKYREALKTFEAERARLESSQSHFELANLYLNGIPSDYGPAGQDVNIAFEIFQRLAKQEDAKATAMYGFMLLKMAESAENERDKKLWSEAAKAEFRRYETPLSVLGLSLTEPESAVDLKQPIEVAKPLGWAMPDQLYKHEENKIFIPFEKALEANIPEGMYVKANRVIAEIKPNEVASEERNAAHELMKNAAAHGHAKAIAHLAATSLSEEDKLHYQILLQKATLSPSSQLREYLGFNSKREGESPPMESIALQDPSKGVEYFKQLSESPHTPELLIQLGQCYVKGIGTNQNFEKAVEAFEKAGAAGENALGNLYLKGIPHEFGPLGQDVNKAFKIFQNLAEKGDARGIAMYGYLMLKLAQTSTNEEEKIKWMQAAEKEFLRIETPRAKLGLAYIDFLKLKDYTDDTQKEWIELRSKLKKINPDELGEEKEILDFIAAKMNVIQSMLEKVIEEHHSSEAMYFLADILGGEPEYTKELMKKAAEHGNADALTYWVKHASNEEDRKKYVQSLRKAKLLPPHEQISESLLSEKGLEDYLTGIGLLKAGNRQEAIRQLELAENKGSISAARELGVLYSTHDFEKAKGYLEKAAEMGDRKAFYHLGNLYQYGVEKGPFGPREQNANQAMEAYLKASYGWIPEGISMVALQLELQGLHTEAQAEINKLMVENPFGLIVQALIDPKTAEKNLEKAERRLDELNTFEIGWLHFVKAKISLQNQALQMRLAAGYKNPTAMYYNAMNLFKNKKISEAQKPAFAALQDAARYGSFQAIEALKDFYTEQGKEELAHGYAEQMAKARIFQ